MSRPSPTCALNRLAFLTGLIILLKCSGLTYAQQDPVNASQPVLPALGVDQPLKFVPQEQAGPGANLLFHDIHFHLTNYIHEGINTTRLLELMDDKVGRVALFGIPLMQKWDYFINGDRRPAYYLDSGAEMYYYSFIDALIARQYLRLKEQDRKRFDPFIVGFNPTDINGKDHIRNVLLTFPNVFVGIGEFSIHKELVSSKVAGHVASVKNPAVDEILKFAGEVGLLTILHCDINEIGAPGDRPAHFDDLKELFLRHPETNIIYAHTGLGRYVGPTKTHLSLIEELCTNDALNHVNFDISWDEVAKWIVKDNDTLKAWADLLNEHPTRFLFGSDAVSPKNQNRYLKTYRDYEPLWKLLTPEASQAIRIGNYERLVDEARAKVRAWEADNVDAPADMLPIPAKPALPKAASLAR